jgi:MFS family permease
MKLTEDKTEEQINSLNDIRTLMENSSRFTSLSGLSGISAGIIAILGSVLVSYSLPIGFFEQATGLMNLTNTSSTPDSGKLQFLILIALAVFTLAAISALFFAGRKAKNNNTQLFGSAGKKFIFNHSIFLFTGALFSLVLIYYGIYFLVVPSLLIFFGLGLISVSKFSFNLIKSLGIVEIILGLILSFIPVYALLFFTIGFGVMNIVYGFIMHLNYDKTNS